MTRASVIGARAKICFWLDAILGSGVDWNAGIKTTSQMADDR